MSTEKPTPDELRAILDAHGRWLRNEADGARADLTGADLTRADLTGADLTRADLTRADLTRADLTGANLTGAMGIVCERHTDLLMLLDQPGRIRAYKLVTTDGYSPLSETRLHYSIGATVEVADANTDPAEPCGTGIHVCTLPWALREWRPGYSVLLVEFAATDIACIPTATDGKFRLHRCTVVGEKDVSAWVQGTP